MDGAFITTAADGGAVFMTIVQPFAVSASWGISSPSTQMKSTHLQPIVVGNRFDPPTAAEASLCVGSIALNAANRIECTDD
tara:strand:- start:509 stop:751 length:243 start_codon:yes stop_codon:yes gene_type:complete